MNPFDYHNPVRVIFGRGTMDRLGRETAVYGRKALLVEAEGPLRDLGVYSRAARLLREAGLEVCTLEKVAANPKLSSVREGIEICRKKGVEVVVAVGGGSVIDCAKAVAVGATDEGDVWDFFEQQRETDKALPIAAVSTLAATGAEMSRHCVITNEEENKKYVTHLSVNFPQFAIIDPELHTTVPRFATACGLCDAITHVAESYFSGGCATPLTDRIAEAVVLTVLESEGLLDDPGNLELRSNHAWAAAVAISGLTDCGRGSLYYGAHTIEHAISARFDIPHGAGLSVVHPAWLAHMCEVDPGKFVQFAERVFGMTRRGRSDEELGMAAVAALRDRYKSWGLPVAAPEIGVDATSFDRIAADCVADPSSAISDRRVVLDVLRRCA
jgi:alcohol dehydrogenase YqhD (iron-dependent ADH family)